MSLPKKNDRTDKRCGLCYEPCEDDQFCHGCKFYICEDHSGSPWGPHDILEHKDPLDDPYDDLEELS